MRRPPSVFAPVLLSLLIPSVSSAPATSTASSDPSPAGASTRPATGPSATQPGGEAASLPAVGENIEAVKTYARGDYAAAAAMLERACRAGRTGIQDRLILARAYLHLGRADEALAVLTSVLESDRENPDANSLTGQVLLNAGKHKDALKYLEHAYRLKRDPVTASALGRCHHALGDLPKAKSFLAAALEEDIRDPANSLLLGRIHLQRGSGALAEKYLLMAQEAGLESVELHLLLGQAYLLQAKPLGPVMVRRIAGSPRPGDVAEACVVLGRLPEAADQYKVATRYSALYEGYQLLKSDKQHPDGLFMVASGWFAADNNELAGQYLRTLMDKGPPPPRAAELKARLLLRTKDFDGLRQALAAGKADKVFDSAAVADFLCRAAAAARAEGKADQAVALLKQAEGEQPISETVLRPLAGLYAAAGNDRQAAAYYSRLVELFPDAADIDELRNALKVHQEKAGVKP